MVTKGIPVTTTSIREEIERFNNVSLNRYAKNLFQGGYASQSRHSASSERELAVSSQRGNPAVRPEAWRDQSSKE
jgi:hypothetical protein